MENVSTESLRQILTEFSPGSTFDTPAEIT